MNNTIIAWTRQAPEVWDELQNTGTYYVRAFVQGTGGDIAYSPVCQVTCDGSVDESAR